MKKTICIVIVYTAVFTAAGAASAADFPKPYDRRCTEREDVFEFTKKPRIELVAKDRYEITFAVKGYCDVTAGMIDEEGRVVRHLGAGVLGKNAPAPFQKDSLEQKIYWKGKDDLGVYVKEPEKLSVRVRLGLKPEFDKLLGPISAKALPGFVLGMVADETGLYVFPSGNFVGSVRKFDHDGKYLKTVHPPAAGTPEEKLAGMAYVEYEPGKRAPFGPDSNPSSHLGLFMPRGLEMARIFACQPSVGGGRIYLCGVDPDEKGRFSLKLYSIRTDGGTETHGMEGVLWGDGKASRTFLFTAASPDGKTVYVSGIGNSATHANSLPYVLAGPGDGSAPSKVFAGDPRKPGAGKGELQNPGGVACDGKGRVYVADTNNNRLQVFSPDGTPLQAIKVDRPRLVQVHQKTGAVYVAHSVRKGRSSSALSKFSAAPELKKLHTWDKLEFTSMALDSWSKKPRIWVSLHPVGKRIVNFGDELVTRYSVRVLEEDNGKLTRIIDFDKEAEKSAGKNFHGRWVGDNYDEVMCDPVREHVYYERTHRFDIVTGAYLGMIPGVTQRHGSSQNIAFGRVDDMAFDKYGYLHAAIPSGLDPPRSAGIGRLDPSATETLGEGRHAVTTIAEVPYDYGTVSKRWKGAIKLYRTDHHFYTWGMGVNMRGDIAVIRDIEYVLGLPDDSYARWSAARVARAIANGRSNGVTPNSSYADFTNMLREKQKQGEEFYVVKRKPGVDIAGSVIFTFDRTGETRVEAAAVPGGKSIDVDIDEDGKLYFLNNCARMIDGKRFMENKAGWYGSEKKFTPTTTVWAKSGPRDVVFQWENSRTKMDPMPSRPADLRAYGGRHQTRVWAKGTEWLYAGAGPFPIDTCECPQMRVHLDWYKRSFVPEVYRHSIGVLDTSGNLILHIGRYGNRDDAFGPKITCTFPRFVSGTDNYLVYSDRGERIVVLKLEYHAEETAKIAG